MDHLAGDTNSSESATNDTNSDEIWEIIDKEDDGKIVLYHKPLTLKKESPNFLLYRGLKEFVCSSLCLYTISHWYTAMVANDRSPTLSPSICTDLSIREY